MSDIIIRKATEGDAAGIANVHINSWREAYSKVLSNEYLVDLPLEFNDRYELWMEVTAVATHPTYVAEDQKYGIIGFVSGGNARDEKYDGYAEVYSIYLLQKFHRNGTGYKLLKSLFSDFSTTDYSKAYVWVLNDKTYTGFYERSGAIKTNDAKVDVIDDINIELVCLEWQSLEI
ncbi:MAG: L-amino acid N-acyltransferase YncA [Gammaproteobacteria bacterium]|jgi:L-amino acid N-acyltransferase YncA